MVQAGGYYGRYLPTGHLVYLHQSTLFAPFDLARNQTRGIPAPVLEDVAGNPSTAGGQLSFSRTGTLVYPSGKTAAENSSFAWQDASGKREPLFSGTFIRTPRISPDGKWLAFHQGSADDGRHQIWILPIDTTDPDHPKPGTPELFLATADGHAIDPRFSPDGRWLAYASSESSSYQIFVRPFSPTAKGGGQAQISTEVGRTPESSTAKEIFYLSVRRRPTSWRCPTRSTGRISNPESRGSGARSG